jgi:hypothetical protein
MIQQVRLIDTIEAAPDSWRVEGGYPESRLVSAGARLVCWAKHLLTTLKLIVEALSSRIVVRFAIAIFDEK